MREPRNRVVQVRRFGDSDGLEVVDAPLPMPIPDIRHSLDYLVGGGEERRRHGQAQHPRGLMIDH